MGAGSHSPLLPAGVVIWILFAVLKGFNPSCSANRAGLIVHRLCRTGRGSLEVLCIGVLRREAVRQHLTVLKGLSPDRSANRAGLIVCRLCRTGRSGLEVLCVGVLRCEAVRYEFSIFLAADIADGPCRAGRRTAGVLGQLFAAGITQVVVIIIGAFAELLTADIALMVVVIVRTGAEKVVTGIAPVILVIVSMEHLAVYAFASGTFMPMICIVALPVTAKDMAAKLAVLRFAFFADRSLHAVRRSAGAGFCHGVARITGADAGVRTVMVRRPITIVMTGGVFRGKGFGFDDLAARA